MAGVSRSGCTPSELVSPLRDSTLDSDDSEIQSGIEKEDKKLSQRQGKNYNTDECKSCSIIDKNIETRGVPFGLPLHGPQPLSDVR